MFLYSAILSLLLASGGSTSAPQATSTVPEAQTNGSGWGGGHTFGGGWGGGHT
jgi:hypothetical protein